MKKIALISDTHGMLRPEVIKNMQGCEAILHGGDINKQAIIDQLKDIAPLYVVRGNNDKEWAEYLPDFLDFSLLGLCIYMTHKKKDIPKQVEDYDLIFYGHSHRYDYKQEGKTHLVNPGSCGPRRFNQEITMAMLFLADTGEIDRIEKISIPHPKAKEVNLKNIKSRDVEKVISEIKRGRSIEQISAKTGVKNELADQICRLYLTHPGIDAEGIMTKLGL